MTDTELAPCGLCGSGPIKCFGGDVRQLIFHSKDHSCPLIDSGPFTQEEWTALHAPAQVLREVDECFEAAIAEGFLDAMINLGSPASHDMHMNQLGRLRDIWIRRLKPAREKAQQLSGR